MSGDSSASAAIVVPGYGGTIEQPTVRPPVPHLSAEGTAAVPIQFSRSKPTEPFAQELTELRQAREAANTAGATQLALVGRSFGGRMCARSAAEEPPAALVLLGHP